MKLRAVLAALAIAGAGVFAASAALGAGGRPAPPARHVGPAQPTAADLAVLGRAERLLERDCMRGAGFALQLSPEPDPENRDFPFAVDDLAWARRHGYGSDLRAESLRQDEADPNARYVASLPPRRRAEAGHALNGAGPRDKGPTVTLPSGVVVGHSANGCTAHAERTLYGDYERWYRAKTIVRALRPVWLARVTGDPEFGAAVGRWSACMKAAGYSYPDPPAAQAAFPGSPEDRPAERRTATAEATCAASSGLTATAARLRKTAESAAEDRYRADVTAYRQLAAAALPRARAAVAKG